MRIRSGCWQPDMKQKCNIRSALKLNSLLNDREYMSKWNVGLASVLLEQGEVQKAAKCMRASVLCGALYPECSLVSGKRLVSAGVIYVSRRRSMLLRPVHKRARLLAPCTARYRTGSAAGGGGRNTHEGSVGAGAYCLYSW